MKTRYVWDEVKRAKNLAKHQLDFLDTGMVLDSDYRLDVPTVRNGEARVQSFAFVVERLSVLTVVHLPSARPHIISFRPASRAEREAYHDWLENDFDGS